MQASIQHNIILNSCLRQWKLEAAQGHLPALQGLLMVHQSPHPLPLPYVSIEHSKHSRTCTKNSLDLAVACLLVAACPGNMVAERGGPAHISHVLTPRLTETALPASCRPCTLVWVLLRAIIWALLRCVSGHQTALAAAQIKVPRFYHQGPGGGPCGRQWPPGGGYMWGGCWGSGGIMP